MKSNLVKKITLLGIALSFVLSSQAQTLATIDKQYIDSKEFMWVFNKNNQKPHPINLSELENYLNLYINFRLKVLDAKSLGFDLDTAYQNEIAGYEKSLKSQTKYNTSLPEYKYLLNEYRDGILMFNISEQKIWNKAQENESLLQAYYENHKSDYNNKNYDEVRGLVINDLQKQLEQEWVQKLRNKYKVKIYTSELHKIAKQ
jgi:hypothetical protein